MQDKEKITGDILKELEELKKLGDGSEENMGIFTVGGGAFGSLGCC